MLVLGLLISLVAMPLILLLATRSHFNSWALVPRLAFWVAVAAVLAIAATGSSSWRFDAGVARVTWASIGWGVLAVVVSMAAMGAQMYVQQRLGNAPQQQKTHFQALLRLPFTHRCFIVATAAVTEEVLYRAYAVGIGADVLGSLWAAGALSVVAFTLAHLRWGLLHLVPVFVSAVALTLLFGVTHNLWVCVLAHAAIDGGILVMRPASGQHRAELDHNTG